MNRKISILLLVAILASLVLSAAPAFAAGEPIVSIPIANAMQGDTITVPVQVDTQGVGIRGYGINLDFDKNKVELLGVTDAGFLGTCPGGQVYLGTVVIDNDAGTMRGASAAYLGCAGKTVSTPAGSPATIANIQLKVKAGAVNGKMNWIFAANTKLIDASAGNMLPPAIVLNPKWVQIGPAPNLNMAISFVPHGTGETFDATVTVTNNGGSPSDPDTVSLGLSNTTPAASTSCPVPSLAVGGTASCTILNAALSTGASNSIATATLAQFGTTKTATYSPVSDSGQTKIDASFGAFLKITPDAQVNFPTLALGANTTTGNLNVKCNTNYQVDVFDNNPTAWHMTEFDGTSFKTIKLSEPMRVASTQNEVTAGTPAKLVSGGVAGQNADLGQDYPLTYSQVLKYADPLLPAGETYHLVLTLNGYVTL
jgi:hypothetical protein